MKPCHLESLLMDHALGELPEDVSSLLESYLAGNAAAREEAAKIREALTVTQWVVENRPSLLCSRQAAPEEPVRDHGSQEARQKHPIGWGRHWPWQAAAAVVIGLAGFWLGLSRDADRISGSNTAGWADFDAQAPSHWARYQLEESPERSGLSLVLIPPATSPTSH